ncbi:uncharacterized protein Pyn_04276 [Prunus yedoensis var. nudiflora]|uniref:Uncharacterized protein n=1 Tax=Prunus yedoensis var. nudiflora TaxID=2094558 RepID=A0A314UWH9_PRUYE|nr:uncharacterized protein Pyn_04276 [Prunus yedoensis var. nudiflora]
MARKSGILIGHLFGNWSNSCAGLLHHRRKLLPSSIQTLTLSSIHTLTPHLPSPCKLPLSSPNLHFVGRFDEGLVFSRPAKMVIISNKHDYDRASKQVTALFCNFIRASPTQRPPALHADAVRGWKWQIQLGGHT